MFRLKTEKVRIKGSPPAFESTQGDRKSLSSQRLHVSDCDRPLSAGNGVYIWISSLATKAKKISTRYFHRDIGTAL